jgi:hypothetical protein
MHLDRRREIVQRRPHDKAMRSFLRVPFGPSLLTHVGLSMLTTIDCEFDCLPLFNYAQQSPRLGSELLPFTPLHGLIVSRYRGGRASLLHLG